MKFLKRIWAEINIDNICENYEKITSHNPQQAVMAVIKADAYGHGDYYVAKELEKKNVDFFAVSNIDEALSLRNKGINTKILNFGATPSDYFGLMTENDIIQTVFCRSYAKELSDFAQQKNITIPVHIKIDTGMGRMGFIHSETQSAVNQIVDLIENYKGLSFEGIYTHFSHSDSNDETAIDYTKNQYANFCDLIEKLAEKEITFKTIHCQNSGGVLKYQFDKSNTIRPGIILYGLAPSPDYNNILDLKPVMSLKSAVSSVKKLEKDAFISYSRKFKAEKDMTVAIIPAGYADGYFRSCYKDGYVLIKGQKAKIVGVICMDQFMVDVTDIENVERGDEVILMGQSENGETITSDDLALWAGTINYEIVCSVARRVPRIYIKSCEIIDCVSYL